MERGPGADMGRIGMSSQQEFGCERPQGAHPHFPQSLKRQSFYTRPLSGKNAVPRRAAVWVRLCHAGIQGRLVSQKLGKMGACGASGLWSGERTPLKFHPHRSGPLDLGHGIIRCRLAPSGSITF